MIITGNSSAGPSDPTRNHSRLSMSGAFQARTNVKSTNTLSGNIAVQAVSSRGGEKLVSAVLSNNVP